MLQFLNNSLGFVQRATLLDLLIRLNLNQEKPWQKAPKKKKKIISHHVVILYYYYIIKVVSTFTHLDLH